MVFIFCSLTSANAQNQINGFVYDIVTLKPIADASVLIKDIDNTILNYTSTDREGKYSIEVELDLNTFYIEIIIISHNTLTKKTTTAYLQKNNFKLDFLLSERITNLDEVLIEGKKQPITVKKDTTSYDINNFKDGTERVVEDLLKKLPGISIKPNGQILFKGKAVTNLLLDGDDIFNENYTIGSKNISSDIIEKVEAIEDYNKNPLLKNIKTSQDIAINLSLKKGKTDISGSGEIGYGIKNRRLLNTNLIAVSKKTKGFVLANHNNIGQNNSPYNFLSNTIDLASLNLLDKKASNLLNNNRFNSVLSDNRVQINNNYYGSLNALYKLSTNSKLKLNYGFFNDHLSRNESTNTVFNFDTSTLNINTSEQLITKPIINAIDIEFTNQPSKKSLLIFKSKYNSIFVRNSSNGFNNDTFLTNITKTKDYFFDNKIEYTYKLGKKKVIQLEGDLSLNKIPQSLFIISQAQNNSQIVNSKRAVLDLKSKFLYKSLKQNETSIYLGYKQEDDEFNSSLSGLNLTLQTQNNITLKNVKPYINLNQLFILKKWEFDTKLKTELLHTNIARLNQNLLSKDLLVLNTYFSTSFKTSKNTNLYLKYNLSNQLPKISNIFEGLILTGNRSLINNNFKYNLLDNHSLNLGYRINDFYNLFQFNLNARYNYNKQGFINQLNIDQNQDIYTQILTTTNNKNINFNLDTEKYLHFLRTTFNIKTSYTINDYQNIVNNSEIRNNTNKNHTLNFGFRTGFKKRINFENNLKLNNNKFINNDILFNLKTFQNDFTIKYIKNNFQMEVNSQFFNQLSENTKNNEFFLDSKLSYKSKKIEYKLILQNLLNNNEFKNLNVTDFSQNSFNYNLQERYILLSATFRF